MFSIKASDGGEVGATREVDGKILVHKKTIFVKSKGILQNDMYASV
jgi:hypothetical protein